MAIEELIDARATLAPLPPRRALLRAQVAGRGRGRGVERQASNQEAPTPDPSPRAHSALEGIHARGGGEPLRPANGAKGIRIAVLAGLLGFIVSSPAQAQDAVAQFYRGKQISLYIGSSAGGGYDTYARLLARRFGSYVPGNPGVLPQNMPGAGSNKLAAFIYSVAPKDGTAAGAIYSGAILQPLIGDTPTQHDPSKFIYLGNANVEAFACIARADVPVKKFDDTFRQELVVGATNEGGSSRDFTAMLDNLLGTKLRIVTGYAGSNEIMLAIERNEVQGMCGIGWSSVIADHPQWLASGFIRILVQLASNGHPEMNRMGVPLALDYAKSEEDREVMKLIFSQLVFGRPYVLPPGVPADRVTALRRAFMTALRDKDTLAEAGKMKLDLDALSGEEVQAEVAKVFATPANIVARAKQALIYRGR
jgi:tripartite-type tricarboxylate transporter receptor subunit TctC